MIIRFSVLSQRPIFAMPFGISCNRVLKLASILLLAAVAHAASASDARLERWPAGNPAPSLQLKDLEGREWNLKNLRGKVVILNFWATWCGPCVEELPVLNDLASSEFTAGKPVVLGINFKETPAAIQRFLTGHPFQYPILLDKTGEDFKKWSNGILPATVLIDKQGKPRWRVIGELNRTDSGLKQAVEKMLEEPSAKPVNRAGRIASQAK
jgi:thiol-disulfide isomerase/thioredoxin